MKLNCIIDGNQYELNVNPDKPLSRILEDKLESFSVNNGCRGSSCGNCMVIVNGECSLACLIPAFRLNDAIILTFEGFSKTKLCSDIEKAYEETGSRPCNLCYASKTLLIESMVEKLDYAREIGIAIIGRKAVKTKQIIDSDFFERELSINSCRCMEVSQVERVVKLAYKYRSNRRGKSK